jgi:hypothetical protein
VALTVGALLGVTACVSGGVSSSSLGGPQNEISREQVEASPHLETAMAVVQRLRPSWLRPRNQGTFTSGGPIDAVVFVDGVRFGVLSSLNQISSFDVQSMEFMSSSDATTLYGTGYIGGIIHVHTR